MGNAEPTYIRVNTRVKNSWQLLPKLWPQFLDWGLGDWGLGARKISPFYLVECWIKI
jgi:hypothetical protein